MTREDALGKLQKLLRLAKSENAGEAAAAAARAQVIMSKYQIQEAMLEEKAEEEEIKTWNDPLERTKRLSIWKSYLGATISKNNGVFMFIRKSNLILVGRATNVQTVRYLYSFLTREIDRLTKRDCAGAGRKYSNNFRLGCIDTIAKRLKEEKEKMIQELKTAEQTETGLMRLNNALIKIEQESSAVEAFARSRFSLRKGAQSSFSPNQDARQAGQRAGNEINLSSRGGIGAATKFIS